MIDSPARLVLIGHPVTQSVSPHFHAAALRSAGIALEYTALDVHPDALDETLLAFARERIAGNVTIPHKEALARHCARLTPLAERCGAVNTFWHEDGALVGHNTDVGGVELMLRALLRDRLQGARVAMIGAGGAAAAVMCAAERCGVGEVRMYNRNMDRARSLVNRFPDLSHTFPTVEEALENVNVVVNATPVGMHDDDLPVEVDLIPADAAVLDLVFRAGETRWVRASRAAGHVSADGEGMLVEQGALAFEQWFGLPADRDAMWRAMR